ncbi:MAG: hypothetical protein FWE52_00250 [Alphaproteobacteria bacterium]|nr:hypothetical protein [Alphaproteobacteria bacterium]
MSIVYAQPSRIMHSKIIGARIVSNTSYFLRLGKKVDILLEDNFYFRMNFSEFKKYNLEINEAVTLSLYNKASKLPKLQIRGRNIFIPANQLKQYQ